MTKRMIFLSILYIMFTYVSTALAADSNQQPTCEELGYSDDIGLCPSKYILCPFDNTKGFCIMEASVGQIAYFPKGMSRPGWLLCSGTSYKQTDYPELASYLGTSFCTTDHGGLCKSGYFKVPKYSGYFLRSYGTPSSTYGGSGNRSAIAPQKEQLPNITGSLDAFYASPSGAFNRAETTVSKVKNVTTSTGTTVAAGVVNFKASSSNSIYKTNGHVIPANIGVYAYMYAGRLGETKGYKICEFGDFYSISVGRCYGENNSATSAYTYLDESNIAYAADLLGVTSYSQWYNYWQTYNVSLGQSFSMPKFDDVDGNAGLIAFAKSMEPSSKIGILCSDGIFVINTSDDSTAKYSASQSGFESAGIDLGFIVLKGSSELF